MIFTETKLKGAHILDIERIGDERGYFARVFCRDEFEEHGLNPFVAQANTSFSKAKGTLRGMHFQKAPHQETKLVGCVQGALYDVVIDLRPESPTFKQSIGVELTPENGRMLYVPKGFAHGFQTLTDDTVVLYLLSEYYAPHSEGGVRFDDPVFGLEWPLEVTVMSEKDQNWPDFE